MAKVESNVHWARDTDELSVALMLRLKGGQTLVTPESIAGPVTFKIGKVFSIVVPQAVALPELAATNWLKSEELGVGRGLFTALRYSRATRSIVSQSYR